MDATDTIFKIVDSFELEMSRKIKTAHNDGMKEFKDIFQVMLQTLYGRSIFLDNCMKTELETVRNLIKEWMNANSLLITPSFKRPNDLAEQANSILKLTQGISDTRNGSYSHAISSPTKRGLISEPLSYSRSNNTAQDEITEVVINDDNVNDRYVDPTKLNDSKKNSAKTNHMITYDALNGEQSSSVYNSSKLPTPYDSEFDNIDKNSVQPKDNNIIILKSSPSKFQQESYINATDISGMTPTAIPDPYDERQAGMNDGITSYYSPMKNGSTSYQEKYLANTKSSNNSSGLLDVAQMSRVLKEIDNKKKINQRKNTLELWEPHHIPDGNSDLYSAVKRRNLLNGMKNTIKLKRRKERRLDSFGKEYIRLKKKKMKKANDGSRNEESDDKRPNVRSDSKDFSYNDKVWCLWAGSWYAGKVCDPNDVPEKDQRDLDKLYRNASTSEYHIVRYYVDGSFSKMSKYKMELLGKSKVDEQRGRRRPKAYDAALNEL